MCPPAAVADAARLAARAGGEDLPLLAAETPAHRGPLPALLTKAVHEQGLQPGFLRGSPGTRCPQGEPVDDPAGANA